MKYANQSVSFIQLQKKSDEIIQKRKKNKTEQKCGPHRVWPLTGPRFPPLVPVRQPRRARHLAPPAATNKLRPPATYLPDFFFFSTWWWATSFWFLFRELRNWFLIQFIFFWNFFKEFFFFWKIFVPVGDNDLDDAALISFLKTKLEIKLN